MCGISIHAPHARSDQWCRLMWHSQTNFNPRSSCEERPVRFSAQHFAHAISIHAPHARSDECRNECVAHPDISIHAPHARSDDTWPTTGTIQIISIHAPHARSDYKASSASTIRQQFQSTLLMRGATSEWLIVVSLMVFQSTLLMRGATFVKTSLYRCTVFQSTLLMRGATVSLSSIDLLDFIIHFSRTPRLFPKTLLLALCLVSPISCVMALRA